MCSHTLPIQTDAETTSPRHGVPVKIGIIGFRIQPTMTGTTMMTDLLSSKKSPISSNCHSESATVATGDSMQSLCQKTLQRMEWLLTTKNWN